MFLPACPFFLKYINIYIFTGISTNHYSYHGHRSVAKSHRIRQKGFSLRLILMSMGSLRQDENAYLKATLTDKKNNTYLKGLSSTRQIACLKANFNKIKCRHINTLDLNILASCRHLIIKSKHCSTNFTRSIKVHLV